MSYTMVYFPNPPLRERVELVRYLDELLVVLVEVLLAALAERLTLLRTLSLNVEGLLPHLLLLPEEEEVYDLVP